jgi:hypothetical protein
MPEVSLVHVLHSRLAALLEGDTILAERLHAYRMTLEQRQTQIRQGQKLLDGYSGTAPTLAPMAVDSFY